MIHTLYITATIRTALWPIILHRIIGMLVLYAILRRIREKGKVATSPVGAYVDKSENNTAALCFKKRKGLHIGPQIKLFKGFDSIVSSKSTYRARVMIATEGFLHTSTYGVKMEDQSSIIQTRKRECRKVSLIYFLSGNLTKWETWLINIGCGEKRRSSLWTKWWRGYCESGWWSST